MDPRIGNDRFLQAAHRLAVQRLRADASAWLKVRDQLARWRGLSGATRSDFYWDRWQALLEAGDAERLEEAVCADSDEAQVLRSVSPISVLMTQRERMDMLRAARQP